MLLFDPMYFVVVGPALLLAMFASWKVRSTFRRYSRVGVRTGMTGAEAAAAVARAGSAQVTIERHPGFLSDHYDPRSKTLRLSPAVYEGRSVAAIAVAAHEAGHAIQDVERYPALAFRSAMVPVAQIGSTLWIWVFFAGLIFASSPVGGLLQNLGILIFAATVVFQLVTLPVEFNASNRARAVLSQSGIVTTDEEERGVSRVLGAAAMTYVAGALTSIATLLYLLMRRD
jgi:hypothetical protein